MLNMLFLVADLMTWELRPNGIARTELPLQPNPAHCPLHLRVMTQRLHAQMLQLGPADSIIRALRERSKDIFQIHQDIASLTHSLHSGSPATPKVQFHQRPDKLKVVEQLHPHLPRPAPSQQAGTIQRVALSATVDAKTYNFRIAYERPMARSEGETMRGA